MFIHNKIIAGTLAYDLVIEDNLRGDFDKFKTFLFHVIR